jgi:hypothetical protein
MTVAREGGVTQIVAGAQAGSAGKPATLLVAEGCGERRGPNKAGPPARCCFDRLAGTDCPMDPDEKQKVDRRLREAIRPVYRTFQMPPPLVIDGCPCCLDTRNTDILLTAPLRQISGLALWRYVSGAFLTVGGDRDFQYLLPRILEVSAIGHEPANDPEIVLAALSRSGWRCWALDKRMVVEALVYAWFEGMIVSDLTEAADDAVIQGQAESVLCGAALAGIRLDRMLLRLSQPDARPVLIDMADRFSSEPSGFWEGVPDAFSEVRAFVARRP